MNAITRRYYFIAVNYNRAVVILLTSCIGSAREMAHTAILFSFYALTEAPHKAVYLVSRGANSGFGGFILKFGILTRLYSEGDSYPTRICFSAAQHKAWRKWVRPASIWHDFIHQASPVMTFFPHG
jgi:hypothetical protein